LDPAATDTNPNNNADSALTTIVIREPSVAPETGFAPGRRTPLPAQPAAAAYSDLGDLWLEIPSLGVRRAITGVPRMAEGWDVTWLGDLAGYLEGTAFPTWKGNSVITGHVVVASGLPGPFARLDRLGYGDSIVVHAWGERYRYEVRQVSLVKPTDSTIFRHEDRAWVTLVTCQGYDPSRDTYRARQVVRAVLMEVDGEAVSAPPTTERGR
jgi:LPXTG-site transpeptidase (sortase) family protein